MLGGVATESLRRTLELWIEDHQTRKPRGRLCAPPSPIPPPHSDMRMEV